MPTKRPSRLLFLSQWFEPEGTFKGLAFVKALQGAGFEVDVVTGFPNYPTGKLFPGYRVRPLQRETIDGVRVTRVPLYPSHDSSSFKRSLNYLSFFVSAFLYTLLRRRRYDAVYVYHPPITVGLAAALSGLIRRTPFILDVQDLWPDALSATGMASKRLERVMGPLCTFTYRRAAAVVAQSNGIGAALTARGVERSRISTIYNWGDEVGPQGRADLAPYGFEGRFTFTYAGNMGPPQALDCVIDAAVQAAAKQPRIQLILVGPGIDHERLRKRVDEQALTMVKVMPAIRGDEVGDVLTASDVLLIHLADSPAFAFTIPSKTQNYLAFGKPILAGLSGEAAALVRDSGGGMVVPPEDVAALAETMVRLASTPATELQAMGARGAQFYRDNLSYGRALMQTHEVLAKVLNGSV